MIALGAQFAKDVLDLLFGASGALYLAFHSDDPGPDGQTSNEFVGIGYARAVIGESDWADAIDGDGELKVKTNANSVVFPEAGATWASGVDATWVAVWKSPTGTTASDFVARMPIGSPAPVLSHQVPYFAPGDLQIALGAAA